MNAPTPPTNRQADEIGTSIKRRRLLMHRIIIKANDLNDNPIGRQVAESQCPCHQGKAPSKSPWRSSPNTPLPKSTT